MAVSINWIPVEERLPDVDVDIHEHYDITYVTYEDLTTGKRYVDENIGFEWWNGSFKWVKYDDPNYHIDWEPFEDEIFRVVAWSKDTVDILPY